MFSSLKVRAKITERDPVFKVRYIGCTETFVATGKGCTNGPVQKLWDNAGEEKSLKRTTVQINTNGILLEDMDGKGKGAHGRLFSIENISFCNADCILNERIFTWICKNESCPSLICHAVLCSSKEKAKTMALVLSRAFQIAYKEWQMSKTKVTRENRRKQTKDIEKAAESSIPIKQYSNVRLTKANHATVTSTGSTTSLNGSTRRDSECQTDQPAVSEYINTNNDPIYDVPNELANKSDSTESNGPFSGSTVILDSDTENELSKSVSMQAFIDGDESDSLSCGSKWKRNYMC
ncbi:protein FAM43A-like [Mizuhopecten yessoensis]|uniref:Protein FAM43A n=1 Tax=Mizuhopecten yessoensis TaxID=6573 RepID=A0A210R0D3_MIZYE|nr:protein FAM43A-like [Mizuhopecten yessoensis]OWF54478.1 Protein FAM43A [Mizuhopecten yessoensis]